MHDRQRCAPAFTSMAHKIQTGRRRKEVAPLACFWLGAEVPPAGFFEVGEGVRLSPAASAEIESEGREQYMLYADGTDWPAFVVFIISFN